MVIERVGQQLRWWIVGRRDDDQSSPLDPGEHATQEDRVRDVMQVNLIEAKNPRAGIDVPFEHRIDQKVKYVNPSIRHRDPARELVHQHGLPSAGPTPEVNAFNASAARPQPTNQCIHGRNGGTLLVVQAEVVFTQPRSRMHLRP
jgi:hypothetical protein